MPKVFLFRSWDVLRRALLAPARFLLSRALRRFSLLTVVSGCICAADALKQLARHLLCHAVVLGDGSLRAATVAPQVVPATRLVDHLAVRIRVCRKNRVAEVCGLQPRVVAVVGGPVERLVFGQVDHYLLGGRIQLSECVGEVLRLLDILNILLDFLVAHSGLLWTMLTRYYAVLLLRVIVPRMVALRELGS